MANPPQKQNKNKFLDHDFSSLLWRVVTAVSPETEILSPFGFGLIMAMVKLGSTGLSEVEIQNVLHFDKERALGLHYKQLLEQYEALVKKNVHVIVVSSLIDVLESKFRQDFVDYAHNHFRIMCTNWNYGKSNGVIKEVNRRFYAASKDTLSGILQIGDISRHSQMIVLNGVYFQALFKKQSRFDPKYTTEESFHNLDGSTVKVDMMSGIADFMYARLEDLKCSAIGIPYEGADFTFVVVLPDAVKGILELNKRMDAFFFQNIREKLTAQKFYAKLPKFTAYSKIKYQPLLKAMGIKAMFKSPDFHGFFQTGRNRHFSTFIQQNLLDITEKGSVCGSRTPAKFKASKLQGNVKFRADHPFLFFVIDDAREIVIFVGCKSNF